MAAAKKVLRTRRDLYNWKTRVRGEETDNSRLALHVQIPVGSDEIDGCHVNVRGSGYNHQGSENGHGAREQIDVIGEVDASGGVRHDSRPHPENDPEPGLPDRQITHHRVHAVSNDIPAVFYDEVDNGITRDHRGGSTASLPSRADHTTDSVHHHVRTASPPRGTDVTDYSPRDLVFGHFDSLVLLVSIASYFVDVGSDIWVAILYFQGNNYWWFVMTVTFVVGPSIVMTLFSLSWYVKDHRAHKEAGDESRQASPLQWASRFLFLLLQIGPVLRYIDALRYGCRSRRLKVHENLKMKKSYFELMVYEDADATLLRLFECFMEAAPQLVLQLYIMAREGTEETWFLLILQVVSTVTSLVSLAWSLSAYHKALRFSLPAKRNMRVIGTALQFLWRVFTIGARVIALAMFASFFQLWVFAIIGAHWAVMLAWIRLQKTKFCENTCEEMCFNVVCALVYIFCYLNLIEGHTRLRYLLYYFIVYVENAGMVFLWYVMTAEQQLWYHYPVLFFVLIGFFIGIIVMCLYYMLFHPNNYAPVDSKIRIKLCLTCRESLQSPLSMQNINEVHVNHIGSAYDNAELGKDFPKQYQTNFVGSYNAVNTQHDCIRSNGQDMQIRSNCHGNETTHQNSTSNNKLRSNKSGDRNYRYEAVRYEPNDVTLYDDVSPTSNLTHAVIPDRRTNKGHTPWFKEHNQQVPLHKGNHKNHYHDYIAKTLTIRLQPNLGQIFSKETTL